MFLWKFIITYLLLCGVSNFFLPASSVIENHSHTQDFSHYSWHLLSVMTRSEFILSFNSTWHQSLSSSLVHSCLPFYSILCSSCLWPLFTIKLWFFIICLSFCLSFFSFLFVIMSLSIPPFLSFCYRILLLSLSLLSLLSLLLVS